MTTIADNERKPEQILLTVNDVCERFHLTRPTVYTLINTGELSSIKIGRARRIPARALEEFIARRLSGGPSDAA